MHTLLRDTKDKKSQRGQSLVELALSLMVILMLLMGAIDFGIALFAYVSMRDAAQDGAIYGSINPTDVTGIKNRAVDAASDVIAVDPNNVIVTINGSACEGLDLTSGTPNTLQVLITHQHPVSTPLVGAMIGSQTITLRAQVTNTILSPICP